MGSADACRQVMARCIFHSAQWWRHQVEIMLKHNWWRHHQLTTVSQSLPLKEQKGATPFLSDISDMWGNSSLTNLNIHHHSNDRSDSWWMLRCLNDIWWHLMTSDVWCLYQAGFAALAAGTACGVAMRPSKLTAADGPELNRDFQRKIKQYQTWNNIRYKRYNISFN